jgi:hypothetical protein
MCGRESGPVPGFVNLGQAKADPQFTLYRQEGNAIPSGKSNGRPSTPAKPSIDWTTKAAEFAKAFDTPEARREMTAELGIPEAAIATLGIGFGRDNLGGFWAFPEHDGAGKIIGITRRYLDGTKKMMAGGNRGLTIPTNWLTRGRIDSPIFLPEGATDTLAATGMHLSAVGRPSCRGCVEQLADLLKRAFAAHPSHAKREIIVLGELDANANGQWPGRDGAEETARALAERLGRRVTYAFPPDKAKDLRVWTKGQNLIDGAWPIAGERLLKRLIRLTAREESSEPSVPPEASIPAFEWRPTDSSTFAVADYRPEWAVKRLLVRRQPAFVGGPRKSLKTTLTVDLAMSLATGTPFLGHFEVPRPLRTAILSGESGEWTLQETARRICKARDIDLGSIGDMLLWQFDLPKLADARELMALRDGLRSSAVDVLVLDPVYLAMMLGQSPGRPLRPENLFDMGPLLLGIAKACLEAGTTPVLVHHSKKGTNASNEGLDLDDLSYAGCAEFARQWLLVSRREKYEPGTGLHSLWLTCGGSTGQGGSWAVDIDEGALDAQFGGRKWEVKVNTKTDAITNSKQEREDKKAEKKHRQWKEDDGAVLHVLDREDPNRQGMGYNRVRTLSYLSNDRMEQAVSRLVKEGIIVEIPVMVKQPNGGEKKARGIRRPPQ